MEFEGFSLSLLDLFFSNFIVVSGSNKKCLLDLFIGAHYLIKSFVKKQ